MASEPLDFFAEFLGKGEGMGQVQSTDLTLSRNGLGGHAVVYLEHASSTTSVFFTVRHPILVLNKYQSQSGTTGFVFHHLR